MSQFPKIPEDYSPKQNFFFKNNDDSLNSSNQNENLNESNNQVESENISINSQQLDNKSNKQSLHQPLYMIPPTLQPQTENTDQIQSNNNIQPQLLNNNNTQPQLLNNNNTQPQLLNNNIIQPQILNKNYTQPQLLNNNYSGTQSLNYNYTDTQLLNYNNNYQPQDLIPQENNIDNEYNRQNIEELNIQDPFLDNGNYKLNDNRFQINKKLLIQILLIIFSFIYIFWNIYFLFEEKIITEELFIFFECLEDILVFVLSILMIIKAITIETTNFINKAIFIISLNACIFEIILEIVRVYIINLNNKYNKEKNSSELGILGVILRTIFFMILAIFNGFTTLSEKNNKKNNKVLYI